MTIPFLLSAGVALISTLAVIIGRHPVHALLYLVTSLLAVAVMLFLLGAPFAAALQVIVYAGAIMVLFLFVLMLLDLRPGSRGGPPSVRAWLGPGLLAAVLLGEMLWLLVGGIPGDGTARAVGPKAVGITLMGPYLIAMEAASLVLLAGLVGAWHLGRPNDPREEDR